MWRQAMLVAMGMMAAAACPAQAPGGPGGEDRDFGVAPVAELRLHAHAAPTPLSVPGARTIRTAELQDLLALPITERPFLFDVLGGTGHDSIPGAIWLADAGRGSSFDDEIQHKLSRTLGFVAAKDPGRLLVFFCANVSCWLSYNAALRAARLGYKAGWYRGGIDAWVAAGGALAPMRVGWKRPELK